MANTGSLIRTEDGTTAYFKNSCKFNEGVDCSPVGRHCEKFGWNPAIAQARLEKFCKERGIPVPLPPREEE